MLFLRLFFIKSISFVIHYSYGKILSMRIKIIALGKIKEKYIKLGIDKFSKRLKPYCNIDITEITPIEVKDENLTQKILLKEGNKILVNIKPTDFVITLEILGKEFSSEEFSQKITDITNLGYSEVVFVIGSSFGLGKNVSNRADLKLSISKMTFLHEFARLILIEQIYRAFKIIKNETYHK